MDSHAWTSSYWVQAKRLKLCLRCFSIHRHYFRECRKGATSVESGTAKSDKYVWVPTKTSRFNICELHSWNQGWVKSLKHPSWTISHTQPLTSPHLFSAKHCVPVPWLNGLTKAFYWSTRRRSCFSECFWKMSLRSSFLVFQ